MNEVICSSRFGISRWALGGHPATVNIQLPFRELAKAADVGSDNEKCDTE
jgi:hypothetical protein